MSLPSRVRSGRPALAAGVRLSVAAAASLLYLPGAARAQSAVYTLRVGRWSCRVSAHGGSGARADGDGEVSVTSAGRQQSLGIPPGCFVYLPDNRDPRPPVIAWPCGKQILLIAVFFDSAAMTTHLCVYQNVQGHWRPVPKRSRYGIGFTASGAFQLNGRSMLVWDIANARVGTLDAHRFQAACWRFEHGEILRVWTRETKWAYPVLRPYSDGDAPPMAVPAAEDPLREFGMHWRWWGWLPGWQSYLNRRHPTLSHPAVGAPHRPKIGLA